MRSKSMSAGLLLLASTLALAAPAGAAQYKINWLIGHPNTDYFEDAATYFKETVEKGSGGRIAVEIKTAENPWEDSGQGTPGPEVALKVSRGEAQMGHSFTNVMGEMDPRLLAFDLPFLFRDYAHVEGVVEGPIGADLLAGLSRSNLVGLTFTYSGGANIISSRRRPISTPADLKGLRVAVFGDAVDTAWLKSLGAVPVSVRHHDDRAADMARADEIDAAVMTWRRHYRGLRHSPEKFAYGSLEGASYLVSVTYVNKPFFDSLPQDLRTLITVTAREAGRIERSKTIDLNEVSKRRLLTSKWGVQAVPLSKESRLAFQEALKPVYRDSLAATVGKDLIERIRSAKDDERSLTSAAPLR